MADADPNCGDGIEWKIVVQRGGGTVEIASGAFPNGGAQDFSEGGGHRTWPVAQWVGDTVS